MWQLKRQHLQHACVPYCVECKSVGDAVVPEQHVSHSLCHLCGNSVATAAEQHEEHSVGLFLDASHTPWRVLVVCVWHSVCDSVCGVSERSTASALSNERDPHCSSFPVPAVIQICLGTRNSDGAVRRYLFCESDCSLLQPHISRARSSKRQRCVAWEGSRLQRRRIFVDTALGQEGGGLLLRDCYCDFTCSGGPLEEPA